MDEKDLLFYVSLLRQIYSNVKQKTILMIKKIQIIFKNYLKGHFDLWQGESGDDEIGFEKLPDRFTYDARRGTLDYKAEQSGWWWQWPDD